MDLTPSAEQLGIVRSAAAFLRDRMPLTRTREMFGTAANTDPAAWLDAAALGWFTLGLPTVHRGVGGGLADEALVFREIGRSLASGPFLSTVLGARVAAYGARPDLAGAIGDGEPVAMVLPNAIASVGPDGVLDGEVQLLDCSERFALAVTPHVAALIETAALTDLTPVPCVDPAVRLYRAVADRVVPVAVVAAADDPVACRGHVLVGAMLTGIVEAVRDIATEHARNRVQFDRPIGVHQAIKHPCADMAVRAELTWAETLFAALAVDEQRADAEFHAVSAQLVAAEAAELGTAATVQILGGMGFTFEHDAHLYVKRAQVLAHLFGGVGTQLTRLLALPRAG